MLTGVGTPLLFLYSKTNKGDGIAAMKFNWFRKKEKHHKEEQPDMTTLEQIKKAYAVKFVFINKNTHTNSFASKWILYCVDIGFLSSILTIA